MELLETLFYITNNSYISIIKVCIVSMGVMITIRISDYEGNQAEVIAQIIKSININEPLQITNVAIDDSIAIVTCY